MISVDKLQRTGTTSPVQLFKFFKAQASTTRVFLIANPYSSKQWDMQQRWWVGVVLEIEREKKERESLGMRARLAIENSLAFSFSDTLSPPRHKKFYLSQQCRYLLRMPLHHRMSSPCRRTRIRAYFWFQETKEDGVVLLPILCAEAGWGCWGCWGAWGKPLTS